MCYSTPTVYVYLRNFVLIGLFCRHVAAKSPIFAVFWTSAFSGVAIWQQSEKVEHGGCTTTNHPLSNSIKIVSVLQRLHGNLAYHLARSELARASRSATGLRPASDLSATRIAQWNLASNRSATRFEQVRAISTCPDSSNLLEPGRRPVRI